jgi:hypothetical protein
MQFFSCLEVAKIQGFLSELFGASSLDISFFAMPLHDPEAFSALNDERIAGHNNVRHWHDNQSHPDRCLRTAPAKLWITSHQQDAHKRDCDFIDQLCLQNCTRGEPLGF